MTSAAELQALLRFLSQDAKVPLATAMGKTKELQQANLTNVEAIAKAKPESIKAIFLDDKVSKQVHNAAKRLSKKRAAGEDIAPSPRKQRKESLFSDDVQTPAEVEASLALPSNDAIEEELREVVLFTNRAPLVLAIAVTLLEYTMPEQPPSSRLSLAQGYVSVTSRSKAVYIGLEDGKSAEEEGFGKGQPIVKLMGRDLRVLRRWGYEWKTDSQTQTTESLEASQSTLKAESSQETVPTQPLEDAINGDDKPVEPPLWALDLESLRKSTSKTPDGKPPAKGNHDNFPIHTPQSARAYLLKSFDTAPSGDSNTKVEKKISPAAKAVEKERNLGLLLRALRLLFDSWAGSLTTEELNSHANNWYFKVRPQVAHGVEGWGGKNVLRLADILALRRQD